MTTEKSYPEALEKLRDLLSEVFDNPKFSNRDYLYWLYWGGPDGPGYQQNLDIDGRYRAHYCLVPQKFAGGGKSVLIGYPHDLAVGAEMRGKGVFIELATKAHAKAVEDGIVDAVIAVTNASSAPGFIRRLEFRLIAQIPVRLGLRPFAARRAVLSHKVDAAFLESGEFDRICQRVDFSGSEGWQQVWSARRLKWRLASPVGRYVIHEGRHSVAITTGKTVAGLRVAILLRLFPTRDAPGSSDDIGDLKSLLAAACSVHGSLFYLYAGLNRRLRVPGITVPRRLLPSPLNLFYCPLTGAAPAKEAFEPAVYEFLDFDAY